MSVSFSNSRSLAASLRQILGGNEDIRVVDYQNEFSDLWQSGLRTEYTTGISTMVICGVESPIGAFAHLVPQEVKAPVDFATHFSAYSWAASFRLRNLKASPTIIILEADGQVARSGASADLLGLYARDVSSGVAMIPSIICLTRPSLRDIMASLRSGASKPLSRGQQAMLRGIIQQSLAPDPDNHHQLGNVVGALMLNAESEKKDIGMTPGDQSLVQGFETSSLVNVGAAALTGLFTALQPATGFNKPVGHKWELDEALRKEMSKDVPVVLFDDMGVLWKQFVGQWLPSGSLHVPTVNPTSIMRLISRLDALCAEPVQRRHLNASDFGISGVEDGKPFILLLDLRLYPAGHLMDELNFIDRLSQLATKVGRAANLKWPAIGESEIAAVMSAWTDEQSDKPDYRRARSWLPRLISLIDPILPIVVFSSTQDPEVLKEFRAYRNIVTDFAKPMFRGILGEAEDWIGAAHRTFEKALRSALGIAAARVKLRKVCSHWKNVPQLSPKAKPSSLVEIFIDESGTAAQKRFAIGAVVLISGERAFDHKTYRSKALHDGDSPLGLWGLDDIEQPTPTSQYTNICQFPDSRLWLQKGSGDLQIRRDKGWLNSFLARMQTSVGEQGAQLFACSLLSEELPDPHNIVSGAHPYHRYRDMLGRLLDGILFHCDPVCNAIESGAQICVDAATAKNVAETWRPSTLKRAFGAHIFQALHKGRQTDFCRTLEYSDVFPVVSGLLLRNARESLADRVIRARAVQLSDFVSCTQNTLHNDTRLDPKPLHYLADWIAHFTCDEDDWQEVPTIPVLKRMFESGFCQRDGAEIRQLLRAQRRWVQGARAMAIVDSARVPDLSVATDLFALTPLLRRNAANWIERLSAGDLGAIFASE